MFLMEGMFYELLLYIVDVGTPPKFTIVVKVLCHATKPTNPVTVKMTIGAVHSSPSDLALYSRVHNNL